VRGAFSASLRFGDELPLVVEFVLFHLHARQHAALATGSRDVRCKAVLEGHLGLDGLVGVEASRRVFAY